MIYVSTQTPDTLQQTPSFVETILCSLVKEVTTHNDSVPKILLIGHLMHTKNFILIKCQCSGVIWCISTWSYRCIIYRRLEWIWNICCMVWGIPIAFRSNYPNVRHLRTCRSRYWYTCCTIHVSDIMQITPYHAWRLKVRGSLPVEAIDEVSFCLFCVI